MNHRGFVRGRTCPRGRRYLTSLAMLAPTALALGCSDDAQRARTIIDDHSATEGPEVPEQEPPSGDSDAAVGSDEPLAEDPGLLGSSHARSYMDVFCEGKADDEKLPQDPRELIQPGVNQGRAVAFNAYYQDCNGAPGPQTCGQYRTQREAGRKIVQVELAPRTLGTGMPASMFANAWQNWDGADLRERPANYDEQARERYGLAQAPFDNPYPLPGEDPNQTHGGSGQLPVGLTQLRKEDGSWSGTIGMTCEICHSSGVRALGELGQTEYLSGMGANTSDLQLLFTDMAAPMPVGMNDSRGVTNAMGLSALLVGMYDLDSLGVRLDTALLLQIPGNTSGSGDTKSPPWWNISHRPRKFWDGGYSTNAVRMDSAILNVPTAFDSPLGNDKAFNHKLRDKVEGDSLVIQTYIESLQSPVYPFPIDTELAEQGSGLFHTFDLWASDVNADIPRPPTNGSCAGCHGAYAPMFVNDPEFLEDPRLAGMAGYVAPLEIIRTDPERFKAFTRPLLEMMSSGWLSYPESSPGYVAPEEKSAQQESDDDRGIFTPGTRVTGACTWQGFLEEDARGYLAPPLHGIWATGPYLHNASLPDIWSVLSPDDRPAIWRRKLTTGEGSEHGLDTASSAYDQGKLGWKYDSFSCGESGDELVDCTPEGESNPFAELGNALSNWSGSINSLGYQVRQPDSREAVEQRKVFNTHRFAKSNTGHDFTRALGDDERRAIIEYLKTL